MFKKKNCGNCGKKLGGNYSYCPYCGEELKNKRKTEEDFGLLGKDDSFEEVDPFREVGFGLPGGFNMILNSLLKNLEGSIKEFDRADKLDEFERIEKATKKQPGNFRQGGFTINISSVGNKPPVIKMKSFGDSDLSKQFKGNLPAKAEKKSLPLSNNLSSEKFKNFSKLEKSEPKVNIRRLPNKIVYEIELPEVKSLEDVSLMNLESGIEIKAIADKKAYSKKISVRGLPLVNYKLDEGKLLLEFKTA
ncbi:MAG TPA: hypothetical protein PLK34_01360 [Candidatus Pacearchaeota archaeon]|nr:hypothetical protein [Candidatus Pacearchaeota archaeon]